MQMIADKYGRSFKTLRVSLLSKCNLSCTYCTMGDETAEEETGHLSTPELLKIIKNLHESVGLQTIRLTGGEPLLYRNLLPVIAGIGEMGIHQIKITTNGFLLAKMAEPMKQAGMQSINVSLDAMDEDIFFLMSKRNNVQRILDGIEAALAVDLGVKLNAVIMKGINQSQIIPLLKYAFERNITIRFLEVMAMGHLYQNANKYFFSQDDLLTVIAAEYDFKKLVREDSSTSNYWQTADGNIFGIIANETEPFCADCNRLRLDSNGNIYGCLSSNHPVSVINWDDKIELGEKLQEALLQKQAIKFTGSELSMLHIGG
ncbi:MAG: GTP 3',8-cyclase MoaA [Ferruginibacter sp.]